jgi:hypothetical protein
MSWGERPRRRSRARRRVVAILVTLVVLAGLAFAADRLARAYVENRVAAKIQSEGFSRKPSVTIDGFPFLTQLASRDFPEVKVTSDEVTARRIRFTSINAILNGVRLNSAYSGGTITRLDGRAVVGFPDLTNALATAVSSRLPPGVAGSLRSLAGALDLSPAGRHEVRASIRLLGSGSATWRISVPRHAEILATLVASSGLPSVVAAALQTITVPLGRLPFGLRISSVRVSPGGLVCRIVGHDLAFGG